MILVASFLIGAYARDPAFSIVGFLGGAALMGSLILRLWKPDDVIVWIRGKMNGGEA